MRAATSEGRTDDEAVDEQHHAGFRRAEHGTGHHGNLEAAEFGQHRKPARVHCCTLAIGGQSGALGGLCQQVSLASQAGIVQPGAATDAFVASGSAGQAMGEQRGRAAVLPIPISPKPTYIAAGRPPARGRRRRPARWPGRTGRATSPAVRCSWPCRAATLTSISPSRSSPKSCATPASTTDSPRPFWRAKTLIAAPPARKFSTICQVTSCGKAETPALAAPWSPAKTSDLRAVQRRAQRLLDQADLSAQVVPAGRARRAAWSCGRSCCCRAAVDATASGGHDFKRMHPILQKAKKASRPRFPHATAKPCPQASQ
jgi:hypothetical protein